MIMFRNEVRECALRLVLKNIAVGYEIRLNIGKSLRTYFKDKF
jgi:hypothetical protein